MRQLYSLLFFLTLASASSLAQSPTSVFESTNCTVVRNFNTDDGGFSSPSIYSGDNDVSFLWSSSSGAWIESSGLADRVASIISPVFINPIAGQVTVGFSYMVPSGTEFRIRVISGTTGTELDIAANTANGPDWDPLPAPSGSICLLLMDGDIVGGDPLRIEVCFRATVAFDMLFDNFATTTLLRQLPVTFLGFVAKQNADGSTKLLWDVADETNVVNYVVERSSNGVDFTAIGAVTAIASSRYNFDDIDKIGETRYYRVKNVDIDGKSKYTPVIKVVPARKASGQILLYPVPAREQVYVQHDKAPPKASITIYAFDGKQVKSIMAVANSYQTYINIAGLASGIYIVKYDDGTGAIQTAKLIKN